MELKHPNRDDIKRDIILLIVPYGIETLGVMSVNGYNIALLIVPYGIETSVLPQLLRKPENF